MPAMQPASCDPTALLSVWTRVQVPREVAVVGCGRWGKIICGVLIDAFPQIATIHVVAARNVGEATQWIEQQRTGAARTAYDRVRITQDLEEILRNEAIEAAFVTKMAAEHYLATKRLLLSGKHVLVEKPFVLRTEEANELIRLAEERHRTLVVGYEYMLARPLHYFRALAQQHLTDVTEVRIAWEEPASEDKWGIRKQPDWSSTIITNLYPHVLSQLWVLCGQQPIALESVASNDHCWHARIRLRYGTIPVTVSLNKSASQSFRALQVTSASGDRLILNYTTEPGTITLNGRTLPDDPHGRTVPKPLPLEIAHFFAQISTPTPDLPTLAKNSIRIVEATEQANHALLDAQAQALRPSLFRGLPAEIPDSVLKMLRHHMVCPLLDHGLIKNPKDERALDRWLSHTFRIVHDFSQTPWTTQAQALEQTRLSKHDLRMLNAAIRDSAWLQRLIVREGLGQKYWGSVLPLIQSGALHAVMTNAYRFPLRTGIYPGVSCMFFCSFCGRNPNARYPFTTAPRGNAMFEQVFASVPPEGEYTFSFSGGLEPLTNPGFGELVRSAKRHRVAVPLITNGFMLSPQYLARQEGVWDLDSLRVSLYGVDEATYFRVTKVNGAYSQVKRNVIDFLRLRAQKRPALKFGFNFIVLPGCTDQVLKVLDLIAEINTAVGNGRGVDFLTLREDFSVPETEGLSREERARLTEVFQIFQTRLKTEAALAGLDVDFGYALMTLSEGVLGKPLAMVTHKQMRPKAYPQISVVVDLLGDVYLYREAGFLERPGADRYRIGTLSESRSLETVIREFLERGEPIPPLPADPVLLDAFDHIVTLVINQAEADEAIGIPFNEGPVRSRVYQAPAHRQTSDVGTRLATSLT